jgi:hypothetical protein
MPSGKRIMASGRFDGGPNEQRMRDTAAALEAMGEEVLIVSAGGGVKFGRQVSTTMACLPAPPAHAPRTVHRS